MKLLLSAQVCYLVFDWPVALSVDNLCLSREKKREKCFSSRVNNGESVIFCLVVRSLDSLYLDEQ